MKKLKSYILRCNNEKIFVNCGGFHYLRYPPSQAVNIADLENARGYAYLYRMNGQNYYAEQRVKVIAGEGNNFEIIGRTYSHQGAQYYMTEYINHYYFDQDNDTIQWVQDQRNIIDARTGKVLREEKRNKAKLITLKPDTYGYMQAIYWRDGVVAGGRFK